ncbi:ComEA family DNA-binding protein [Campylobacter concisus]|uniref:ComEA family DNA-binding protein n=1 Tax=Campylobacter concisus TaxID=199 RepID=UPI000D30B651|nr:helix-hairpin-helix domain-containing protein [Campylobacter concisus]
MRIKILLCLVVASIAYGANLNTASKNELMELGLSKGQALNIIKYRKAHKFKSIDELEKVQGIGFNDMQKVKAKLNIKENAKVKKSEAKNSKGKKK